MFSRLAAVVFLAAAVSVAACTSTENNPAPESAKARGVATAVADTDDFGVPLPTDTMLGARVVSLVPAATEVIFAMGAGHKLVGRTTWDLYPDSARLVPNMGDGIHPNIEVVLAAKPTLVVLYASMENRTAAAAFTKAGIAVMTTRVDRIADFVRITQQLGVVLNARTRATTVIDSVQGALARVRSAVGDADRPTVVWPLYDSPVYVVGRGSFIAELLDIAGADNIFSDLAQPSPEVTVEEIAHRNPQFVLASPAAQTRMLASPKWQSVPAVRSRRILVVDTLLVGRPTVTLGMAALSLAKLLHPDRVSSLR